MYIYCPQTIKQIGNVEKNHKICSENVTEYLKKNLYIYILTVLDIFLNNPGIFSKILGIFILKRFSVSISD